MPLSATPSSFSTTSMVMRRTGCARCSSVFKPTAAIFSGSSTTCSISPRSRPGNSRCRLSDYSLKDVVHGVVNAVEPLAVAKHLVFKAEVPPTSPDWTRRRAAHRPSPAQPRRQRHQVHRRGRSRRQGLRQERVVYGLRLRLRAWHQRGGPDQDLRRIPAGRQLVHEEEGRDRTRIVDRQADRRDAQRKNLGRVGSR